MSHRLTVSLCVMILAAAGGCSSDPMSPSSGSVTVLLTDAPIDLSQVSGVWVTLDELLLYGEDSDDDVLEMDLPPISTGAGLTLNLLDFQNGETFAIAELEAPAGDYHKLRMRVAEAWLTRDDDNDSGTPDLEEPIFVPSGKVDIPVPFSLGGGEKVEVTIDFDAQASVQVNATPGRHAYILRPVITPVSVTRR